MKRWKKALVSLLTGCLVCGMIPVNAKAAETQPQEDGYGYTITLSAGNKGLIDGQSKIVMKDQKLNSVVNFQQNLQDVEISDDRYYVCLLYTSTRYTDITLSKDKDWTATIDRLPITNEYQVVEKGVPAGYISTSEVSEDGAIYTVTNTLKWSLSKANMPESGETEKYLAGAEFNLTDNTGKIIATGVSGEKGLITWTPQNGMTKADLNALDGEYTVTETKAPSGYQKLQGVWTLTFDMGVLTKAEASEGYESYISDVYKRQEEGSSSRYRSIRSWKSLSQIP